MILVKRTTSISRICITILMIFCWVMPANSQLLGTLTVDPPGVDIIGVEIAIDAGLPDSSVASFKYRKQGDVPWQNGPDLMRVRPELGLDLDRDPAFAGAIWNLESGTTYEVQVELSGPGISNEVANSVITTRALAAETFDQPANHVIDATSQSPTLSEVQAILDSAQPGEIVELQGNLSISGPLYLQTEGTESSPIYFRGVDGSTISNTSGSESVRIISSYWVLENMAILGGSGNTSWTVRIDGRFNGADPQRQPVRGVTVRRTLISGRKGMRAWEGNDSEIYDLTVYNNVFNGVWSWPEIVSLKNGGNINQTWNDTGFKVTGQGHSVFNNSFSGFGDSIKTDRETSIPNTTISYSRNRIQSGGDDGIELDDAFRNVVATENLILNTGTGVSKQPNFTAGGPNYISANVMANQFLRPFKLNDGPQGLFILNNTVVQSDSFTPQFFWLQNNNGRVDQLFVLNNLFVYTEAAFGDQLIRFDADLSAGSWDGNAYYPNAEFEFNFFGNTDNFQSAQGNSSLPPGYAGQAFESNGVLLGQQPFVSGLGAIGDNWESFVVDFDPRIEASSDAATAEIDIVGYPSTSRGAIVPGAALPGYGANIDDNLAKPNAPTGLVIE